MHLVEVFLPTGYPNGDLIPQSIFDLIEGELREKFDGVVVYARKSARTLSRSHARQMENRCSSLRSSPTIWIRSGGRSSGTGRRLSFIMTTYLSALRSPNACERVV